MLSNKRSDIFLESLRKNPIKKIFEEDRFSIEQIYRFDAFEEYFIYLPEREEEELYFIKKGDVTRVAKNLKVSLKNDWKNEKKHLLI